MHHTYSLTVDGFVPPHLFLSQTESVVTVSDPRGLVVEGTTLILRTGEPDLPVGQRVKVWFGSRWFHCETVDYISFKEAEAAKRKEAETKHHEEVVESANKAFVEPTALLLKSSPTSKQLEQSLKKLFLEQENHHRIYKVFWSAYDEETKRKSNDACVTLGVINKSISLISEHLFEGLKDNGIQAQSAYAYSPREGGGSGFYSPGRDHLQLLAPLKQGRLERHRGDALCKVAEKFWGLEGHSQKYSVNCKACLLKMTRLY